jgi:ribosome modulation factor
VVVIHQLQLSLAGICVANAALNALAAVHSRVNMSNQRSDIVILDHAYDEGKLAGISGLETSAACPFGSDQTGPRIAWLDGFADGVWQGAAKIGTTDQTEEYGRAGLEVPDRIGLDMVDTAIAHLLRLSKAIGPRREQDRELDSALRAATIFMRSVRLTQAARQDRPELTLHQKRTDMQTRQGRLGATAAEMRLKMPSGPAVSRVATITGFPLSPSNRPNGGPTPPGSSHGGSVRR